MTEIKQYVIQQKPEGGGFTLIGPGPPVRFQFATKREALEEIKSMIGGSAFEQAEIIVKDNGSIHVTVHEP